MAGGPSLTVYRAAWSTNCERVAIALAHKGIEARSVMIDYSNRAPVVAISGQELVPVIEDGGVVVSDSVAILRHLDERAPERPLFFADPSSAAELDIFIEWFERVYKLPPNLIEAELDRVRPDTRAIGEHAKTMTRNLGTLERLLADGREYLLGDFSAADCIAYPFLKYASGRDPADDERFHVILEEKQDLGEEHPLLSAWIGRVGALPRAY